MIRKKQNAYLEKLLAEVIDKYGRNENYAIPTISWSKEFKCGAYGEYQYWKNHIEVSKLFQDERVTDDHLKAIIYHELIHQTHQDHDKEFVKLAQRMKNNEVLIEDAIRITEDVNVYGEPNEENLKIDPERRIYIVKLLELDDGTINNEKVAGAFFYQNHSFLINLPAVSKSFEMLSNRQVVFAVESGGVLYASAWSTNASVIPEIKTLHLSFGDVRYNAITRHGDIRIVFPGNEVEICRTSDLSEEFMRTGISLIENREACREMAELLNLYPYDYWSLGITDDAICSVPGIENSNVDVILEWVRTRRVGSLRNIWDMNYIVKLKPCRDSYLERGIVLSESGIVDEAIKDFEMAKQYNDPYTGNLTDLQIQKLIDDCRYDSDVCKGIV